MFTVKQTKKTKQFELFNEAGEVAQKVCKSCQQPKLAEDFPKYANGMLRPDCQPCFKKLQSKYVQETKDKRTVYKQRERARKLNLPDSFTEEEYLELKSFAAGKCMISGKEVELEIDHFQALSKGWLGSTKGNMILVSEEVNQAKRTMSLFEFLQSPRSKGLVDKEQLQRTLEYLAQANGMSMNEYIQFLYDCEEFAERNKQFWG
ncbi:hypothetical protein [Metabacillus sp. FJAT-53654]|uniref:HNH endonuclease n=1 Tax=Metabacillus rhizosphaerae TaxID=3117747 RepID=A0ABZ2MNP6_9BACI